MKLHLIMHENRDEHPRFAYHQSAHPKATLVTPKYILPERRIVEIATTVIPQSCQDKFQSLTDDIRRLVEERREYLDTVRAELGPQLQTLIDQYIADHPEELL